MGHAASGPGSGSARIAYLASQYPATSHTFIRREVEALRAQGANIATFSVRRPVGAETTSPADAAAARTTFYILPTSLFRLVAAHMAAVLRNPARYFGALALATTHRVPGMKHLVWALFHFAEAILLAGELRRVGARHLHIHFANAGATVGMIAARYLGLPFSLTLHGISETDYPAGALLSGKLERAEFVACASWFMMAQAMRSVDPSYWHKLKLVRCGLDLARIATVRMEASQKKSKRIICVGRLSSEKGQKWLIEAFARISRDHPEARLELVGDGPLDAHLKAHASALLKADTFEFRGRLDEYATLKAIAEAEILALPSFMEGLPVVLMEAMALDTLVVSSHIAGIPELIRDGETGFLFAPGNLNALEDGLRRALESGVKSPAVRLAARVAVAREFAIENVVAPLLAAFAESVADTPALPSRRQNLSLANRKNGHA